MGDIAVLWADPGAVLRRDFARLGLWIERDPKCPAFVTETKRCGKPATERRSRLPYWSLRWCPDHAQDFN